MAAKRVVSLRLDGELVDWADRYATDRESSRTAVVSAALSAFRDLSAGGVPDLPEPEPSRPMPRADLFAGLTAPDSVRFGVKKGEK
jgi:hypothetical protein